MADAVVIGPEVLEERRRARRLREFDDTIAVWERKLAEAQQMLDDARAAKSRFEAGLPSF